MHCFRAFSVLIKVRNGNRCLSGALKVTAALWPGLGEHKEAWIGQERSHGVGKNLIRDRRPERAEGTLWLEHQRGKSRLPGIHTPEVWTSQSSLRPSITIAASGYRRCLNPGFLERAQYQADYPTERRTLRASK